MSASRSSMVALGATLIFLAAAPLQAQTQAAGAPAEGVDVPIRYTNPSDSRSLLTVQPPQPTVTGPAAPSSAGPSLPPDGAAPLVNTQVLGFSERSDASAGVWVDAQDVYRGVIPGSTDSVPHIARHQASGAAGPANTLTWIGFQPLADQTRIFLQTGAPPQYQVVPSPDGLTVVIRLRNTQIGISNFMRFIDASFFGRPVSRVETTTTREGVTEVTIALSRPAEHRVSIDGHYIFVDFVE